VKQTTRPTIFKWRQTAPALILCAVRWYPRYSLSLHDVEDEAVRVMRLKVRGFHQD
jgi:transposase-like protein